MAVVADRDRQVGVGRGERAVDRSRRRSAGRCVDPVGVRPRGRRCRCPAWVTWSTVGSSKPSRDELGPADLLEDVVGQRVGGHHLDVVLTDLLGEGLGGAATARRGRARTSRPAPRRTRRRSGAAVDESVISCTTPCRTKPIGTTVPSAAELVAERGAHVARGAVDGARARSSRRRPRPPRRAEALPQPVSTRPAAGRTAPAVRRAVVRRVLLTRHSSTTGAAARTGSPRAGR